MLWPNCWAFQAPSERAPRALRCVFPGLEAGEQRILFNGVQLEDGQVLAEAGVSDDSTLMCLLRLLGGAKKRKKKTYTKPKKQKHKHKKIKLRVLKFYKVSGLGFHSLLRASAASAGAGRGCVSRGLGAAAQCP